MRLSRFFLSSGLFALFIVLVPSAWASFDINKYCKEVSDISGGSYQIEESCRDMERQSQTNLSRMDIPPRIKKYCTEVAIAAGGSYQIMEGCVQMEMEAKGKIE